MAGHRLDRRRDLLQAQLDNLSALPDGVAADAKSHAPTRARVLARWDLASYQCQARGNWRDMAMIESEIAKAIGMFKEDSPAQVIGAAVELLRFLRGEQQQAPPLPSRARVIEGQGTAPPPPPA